MANVSINDYKLHEVEMLLPPYGKNTISYLKYPEHRIQSRMQRGKLFLKIPAFLALELYRRAILPQNPADSFSVQIGGRSTGKFVITDFRYPDMTRDREMIRMTLQRVD